MFTVASRKSSVFVRAALVGLLITAPESLAAEATRESITESTSSTSTELSRADWQRLFPATDFVEIPGGTFEMGWTKGWDFQFPDERDYPHTPHRVTVSAFRLQRTEVTREQWESLMPPPRTARKDCPTCPVESVSWNQVQEFLQKLNALGIGRYRLPTEAEWEYAAKVGLPSEVAAATLPSRYHNRDWVETASEKDGGVLGQFSDLLCPYEWLGCEQDLRANPGGGSQPVASKLPNRFGLYDMVGNAEEWVADWYGPYPASPVVDPNGPSSGTYKVIRGSRFGMGGGRYYVVRRKYRGPEEGGFQGFRMVKVE